MKPIGGEAELKNEGLYRYVTDSGRSSIRLILSSNMKNSTYLLPDFLCKVILDVFNQAGAVYSFYHVKNDFTIDWDSVKAERYDALYVIDYFGKHHSIASRIPDNVTLIEDGVFLPYLDKPKGVKNWIGFNSFRKVSRVADGSIIKSTKRLPGHLIQKSEAAYPDLKYKAKQIKHEYMHNKKHSERKYLSLFNRAEKLLDRQKAIHTISTASLLNFFEFNRNINKEYSARKANYNILDKYLNPVRINLDTDYPSFYVLKADRRDELRRYLFLKKVFLPSHWPKINGIKSALYENILPIPVDSRFCKKDMMRIAALILGFYKGKIGRR